MEARDSLAGDHKVAGNQVNIPVIQTGTNSLTQIQQNVNKVLTNIYGQFTSLGDQVSQVQGLGDIILSSLSLSQFQTIHGTTWIESNGQSCVGTSYESLTGNKVVPNITVIGATPYIKVN